ncbi:MAG: O-antigen ligase family protein [Pseudomonadales bacterium]
MATPIPSVDPVAERSQVLLAVRYLLSLVLLCAGLVAALLFYGPSYNLLFAWVASLCAVLALLLAGPDRLYRAWLLHPVAVPVASVMILLLFLQHALFAQSAETSYPVVWIVASAPLGALTWLAWSDGGPAALRWPLLRRVPLHFLLPALLVAALAVLALVRFVVWGVRPHDPLVDSSGFGILMYITWVPAAHYWLTGAVAQGGAGWRLRDALMLVLALIVLVVIFATASLACAGLIAAAMVAWLIVAGRGKVCWRRLLMLTLTAGIAYAFSYSQSSALQTSMAGELAADAATEQRVLLVAAAVDMLEQSSLNGGGLFSYAQGYARLRTPADQTSDGSFVHNDYLQLLVEGGLWLFIPVVLFALLVGMRSLTYLTPLRLPGFTELDGSRARHAGGWFALGMICVHMLVNFVLYTMALAVAIGLVAAWACARGPAADSAPAAGGAGKVRFAAWLLAAAMGAYGLGLFALDVMSASVFAGQPSLFGSSSYRQSAAAQMRFAERAEQLNANRATPVLAQALFAKAMLEQGGADPEMRSQYLSTAVQKFDQVRDQDPANLTLYLGYAGLLGWLEGPGAGLVSAPGVSISTSASELLEEALRRDPRSLEALAALASTPRYRADPQALYRLLQARFYPWLASHWRQSRDEAQRWLNRLAVLAQQQGDQAFLEQLRVDRERLLKQRLPAPYKSWFIRWQQRRGSAT